MIENEENFKFLYNANYDEIKDIINLYDNKFINEKKELSLLNLFDCLTFVYKIKQIKLDDKKSLSSFLSGIIKIIYLNEEENNNWKFLEKMKNFYKKYQDFVVKRIKEKGFEIFGVSKKVDENLNKKNQIN